MNAGSKITKALLIFVTLNFLASCATSPSVISAGDSAGTAKETETWNSLVSVQWLSERLSDPNLVILDTTVIVEPDGKGSFHSVSGLENFETGHVPSAGFADLKGNLSDAKSSLEMTLPSPEQFRDAMQSLGVGDDSVVVLYTTNNPDWAARVWWMLRWIGFDRAALLDGGLQAWQAAGLPLSKLSTQATPGTLSINLRPQIIADQQQVLAAIDNNNVHVVDALPDAHYRGGFSMYARPGHITGATNMPSSDLLNATGHYRSFDELDMMHGDNRNDRVITYCGGGVAAASVAFTMSRLGYKDIGVYIGSLQEWAADPDNPMTVEAP